MGGIVYGIIAETWMKGVNTTRHVTRLFCRVFLGDEIHGTWYSIDVFRFIVIPVPFLEKNPETEMSPHHQKNLRQIVPPILSLRARLAQSDRASDSYLCLKFRMLI